MILMIVEALRVEETAGDHSLEEVAQEAASMASARNFITHLQTI